MKTIDAASHNDLDVRNAESSERAIVLSLLREAAMWLNQYYVQQEFTHAGFLQFEHNGQEEHLSLYEKRI